MRQFLLLVYRPCVHMPSARLAFVVLAFTLVLPGCGVSETRVTDLEAKLTGELTETATRVNSLETKMMAQGEALTATTVAASDAARRAEAAEARGKAAEERAKAAEQRANAACKEAADLRGWIAALQADTLGQEFIARSTVYC